jgi:D-alanyl-D-alanine carboxypeptidase/D-alanyl-D-alanine-endopeptidase (penicillin-binding protein 4)
LVPAIIICNQRSHNFYAEQFLRAIGAAKAGEGSIEAGHTAATQVLEGRFGAGMGPMELIDGSGLSYGNEASATYLVNLLDAMHRSEFGEIYRNSLKDRPAGNVKGQVKTGTHNEARALAGYLQGPSGKRYAFAILLNRAQSSSIAWADKLRESLYQALANLAR